MVIDLMDVEALRNRGERVTLNYLLWLEKWMGFPSPRWEIRRRSLGCVQRKEVLSSGMLRLRLESIHSHRVPADTTQSGAPRADLPVKEFITYANK